MIHTVASLDAIITPQAPSITFIERLGMRQGPVIVDLFLSPHPLL